MEDSIPIPASQTDPGNNRTRIALQNMIGLFTAHSHNWKEVYFRISVAIINLNEGDVAREPSTGHGDNLENLG